VTVTGSNSPSAPTLQAAWRVALRLGELCAYCSVFVLSKRAWRVACVLEYWRVVCVLPYRMVSRQLSKRLGELPCLYRIACIDCSIVLPCGESPTLQAAWRVAVSVCIIVRLLQQQKVLQQQRVEYRQAFHHHHQSCCCGSWSCCVLLPSNHTRQNKNSVEKPLWRNHCGVVVEHGGRHWSCCYR